MLAKNGEAMELRKFTIEKEYNAHVWGTQVAEGERMTILATMRKGSKMKIAQIKMLFCCSPDHVMCYSSMLFHVINQCLFSQKLLSRLFLAVHNSSIGDLVTH